MFVVIFVGTCRNPVLELGVDPFAEEIGSQNDADCMIKIWVKANDFCQDLPVKLMVKRFRACMHGCLRDL